MIDYHYNDTMMYPSIHVVKYRSMCVCNVDVAHSLSIVYPVYRDSQYMYRISWGMMSLYMSGQVWYTQRSVLVCDNEDMVLTGQFVS
jgi:hypothetical protein